MDCWPWNEHEKDTGNAMINKCNDSNHNLEVIYCEDLPFDNQYVVRWCSNCGAVVIDLDNNNRTYPGVFMRMKFVKKVEASNEKECNPSM